MVIFLSKRLVEKRDFDSPAAKREAYGILCGVAGICFNILLFAAKVFAGLISGSIAITADAFNNLSDAASSVITLIGFRLAGQKPDPHHPFGHGRMEYISGLIVSMIILLMGLELLKSSVEKILHPSLPEFSVLVAAILILSICVKLYMAYYNRRIGKQIHSPATLATAADSLSDCLATGFVLIASLVGRWTQLAIDGWCGILVSALILVAGVKAARDTINPLLGQPPEPEFIKKIEDIVLSYPEITAIHDLIVHNYGPGRVMISLHAEVANDWDLVLIHDVIDNAEQQLVHELNCSAVIHMDPIAIHDPETIRLREEVMEILKKLDPGITIHDFRIVSGPTHTNLIFDMMVPADCKIPESQLRTGADQLIKTYLGKNYHIVAKVDCLYT